MTNEARTKVLVLGATGMLGNTVLRCLIQSPNLIVSGSVRSDRLMGRLPTAVQNCIQFGVEAERVDSLLGLFERIRPHVVINCIGIVKQLSEANDPLACISTNSILPHRLAKLCAAASARLIHISTDCVFDGRNGNYAEQDSADAQDLYGRSKYLGEVDYHNAITLRTSIIGHELGAGVGLLGWFLASEGEVRGFRQAIFSGVPAIELSEIIRDHVIPRPELRGVYHVAAKAISKYDLLQIIAKTYRKEVRIVPDDSVVIDRSLDASRFSKATGYQPQSWPNLIKKMHEFG